MRILPDRGPRPRLLDSAVTPEEEVDPAEDLARRATRKFRRFIGTLVSLTVIALAIAFWIARHDHIDEEAATIRKLLAVGTQMLSGGTRPTAPPTPIVVQLDAGLVQVTSIALGHPRLAVINGRQVAEGDLITVHTPTRSVAVTLRVLEISDRQVKLSDGMQMITVHLAASAESPR